MELENLKKTALFLFLGLHIGIFSHGSESSLAGSKRQLDASESSVEKRRRVEASSSDQKEESNKKFTVGIVGLGHVGARTVQTLTQPCRNNCASEVFLLSRNFDKAKALARDCCQLRFEHLPLTPVNNFKQLAQSDVIIISAGVHKPIPRDQLLNQNKPIIKSIIQGLSSVEEKNQNAVLVIAANPVEDLSHYALLQAQAMQYLNKPTTQIIGSGTSVDTARLYSILKEHGYSMSDINDGYILGEHGNGQFINWSSLKVKGLPVSNFIDPEKQSAVEDEVKRLGYEIVKGMRHSMTTVADCLVEICQSVKSGGTLPLSVYEPNQGVYVSLLTQLGRSGVQKIMDLQLTDQERVKLQACIDQRKTILPTLMEK